MLSNNYLEIVIYKAYIFFFKNILYVYTTLCVQNYNQTFIYDTTFINVYITTLQPGCFLSTLTAEILKKKVKSILKRRCIYTTILRDINP